MKEKTIEFLKRYAIGFILGLLSAGIVVVYAETFFPSINTTYDNSSTGMQATEVQGALDELYTTCFPPTAGDQIIKDNNLEKDPYECRYFFTGATPNNYITFNDETWRIISIGCDNTIKIMRDESIEEGMKWNESNSNNWARPATLNTYLNEDYYDSLTSVAQSQIVPSNYSIGEVNIGNNNLTNQINDENSRTWNGKIALITVSEYLRTNSNANCKTFDEYNDYYTTCRNSTWMYTSKYGYWWTLSASSGNNSTYVFLIHMNGPIHDLEVNLTYGRYAVRPVVTLSSEVQITGGDGSQSNPYTIE